MSRSIAESVAQFAALDSRSHRDAWSRQVQGLSGAALPIESQQRRGKDRFSIPYSFQLVPLDADGTMLIEQATTVVGKDLSLSGMGFSHSRPLPHRRAIISLDHPKVGRFAVEAEIVWTRTTPIGVYESGCRLIRTVDGHILNPNP
jgi:hypothetical protein